MSRASSTSAAKAFKKVSHVIFDLDGLLLDSEKSYTKVISGIAKEHGKVYTNEIRLKLLGTPDKISSKIAVSEMKLPMSSEQFLQMFRERSKKLLVNCALMPGAERLVRHFHGNQVPIAIATSSTKASAELKTARYKELFSLFSHIVTGGSDPEVKHGKPNPDVFLVCARRFHNAPNPEQCLVLEDAPNGVTAATKAGMQCVMVPDPHMDPELTKEATVVLKTLDDLKPELFGLPAFSNS